MAARPIASTSQPSLRAPTLGVPQARGPAARPAQTPAAAQAQQQVLLTAGKKLTERLAGEALFLEGGPSGRLTLSLRSGIPEEVDFALERLIYATDLEPDLVPPHHHVQLTDALLNIIAAEVERHRRLPAWPTGPSQSRRRALEAGLVLRNMVGSVQGVIAMLQQAPRRLPLVMTEVLELDVDSIEASEDDSLDELKIYMLEVLEVIAAQLRLANRTAEKEATTKAAHLGPRLFNALTSLTYSPDRALVLFSFRCLAELAKIDAHEYLFTSPAANSTSQSPLARSLELLPLLDPEMAAVVLDYLFAVTTLPNVAIQLCGHPQIQHVLRQLLIQFVRGGSKEEWEAEVKSSELVKASSTGKAKSTSDSLLLPGDVLRSMLAIGEPLRTTKWMQYVFEAKEGAEVTQVALWTAYKEQFEEYDKQHKMLPAADVIKQTTDAFHEALPMVTPGPDKRFIIRGISVKNRRDVAEVYRCKWLGCLSPKEAIRSSPLLLNAHLRDVHIFPSAGETRCNWLSCTYQVPPSLSDATPQRIASALALHARIHVPSASATEIRLPLPVKATQAKETIRYTLLNAPTNDAAKTNAVGRGFMACLVFRNVARAIRQGISPSYRHPGDIPDEEEDEVDGEYSAGAGGGGGGGGELFAAVSSSKGGANQTVEEREEEEGREAAARDEADHSRQLAINAVPALLSLETEVVRFAVECRAFAQPLGEVLEVVAFLRKREAVVAVDRMQD